VLLSEGTIVMLLVHRDHRYVAAASEAALRLLKG